MSSEELDVLVSTWVDAQMHARQFPQQEKHYKAIEAVSFLVDVQPEDAWQFIQAVLNHPEFEQVRGILGASTVEDLLAKHGSIFIERVEALASIDERFRSVLGEVWLDEEDTPIWQRVYAAAGMEPKG